MERPREGVTILLNDMWPSAVIDFEYVNSKIIWITFKFSRIKVCVVAGYGLSEEYGEEMGRFWNGMDRILDRVENGYRLHFGRSKQIDGR